jgi:HPr Serine kinase C-terminal domain
MESACWTQKPGILQNDGRVHSYSAYGLTIHSILPIPELVSSVATCPDVCIQLGAVQGSFPKGAGIDDCFHLTASEAHLQWEHVGAFRVRNGNEITIELSPQVDQQFVRMPLLGIVMAVLLHQRGLLVLHGSAVAVQGSAVVFLGGKGYGKSTAAAALYRRGHSLLADDTVVLASNATGDLRVLPGFPQFKLWPEAVASALGEEPDSLPRLATNYDKRARRVGERFSAESVPLRRIYALADGPAPLLKRLPPRDALQTLIGHSYVARFGNHLLRGEHGSRHFSQCADVLKQVPVCALERPRALPLLADVARLVEDDVALEKQTA